MSSHNQSRICVHGVYLPRYLGGYIFPSRPPLWKTLLKIAVPTQGSFALGISYLDFFLPDYRAFWELLRVSVVDGNLGFQFAGLSLQIHHSLLQGGINLVQPSSHFSQRGCRITVGCVLIHSHTSEVNAMTHDIGRVQLEKALLRVLGAVQQGVQGPGPRIEQAQDNLSASTHNGLEVQAKLVHTLTMDVELMVVPLTLVGKYLLAVAAGVPSGIFAVIELEFDGMCALDMLADGLDRSLVIADGALDVAEITFDGLVGIPGAAGGGGRLGHEGRLDHEARLGNEGSRLGNEGSRLGHDGRLGHKGRLGTEGGLRTADRLILIARLANTARLTTNVRLGIARLDTEAGLGLEAGLGMEAKMGTEGNLRTVDRLAIETRLGLIARLVTIASLVTNVRLGIARLGTGKSMVIRAMLKTETALGGNG